MRAKFSRESAAREWTFQEFLRHIHDAAEHSGLPMARTASRRLRITAGPPLIQGQTSRCEYLDFDLGAPLTSAEFAKCLAPQFPDGVRLLWQRRVGSSVLHLKAAAQAFAYRIAGAFDPAAVSAFHASARWPMARTKTSGLRHFDLKRSVLRLEADAEGLSLVIAVQPDGTPKPAEVVAAVFGLDLEHAASLPTERIAIGLALAGRPRSHSKERL